MPPAIEVTDLRKSYGDVEAVRGVSFDVERGEVFGLLGPNGAGKTTTVEILEGYRKRSGGEIAVLGRDPESRDLAETIALVGLDGKEDQRVARLSGGQQRRLDLALALVGDPELIFLDEPTTGFDPAARRTAWGVVRRLKELDKTVLLTTHYLDEAQELADRVAIVKAGRIVAEGPPSQLGSASAAYRVSYLSEGRRVELQTDDPTELLPRLTRDALAP